MVDGYAPLPVQYRHSPAFNLSVDVANMLTGTGYINLNLALTIEDEVDKYIITNNDMYSDHVFTAVSVVPAVADTFEKVQDLDFDVVLNQPLTLNGTVIVSVAVGMGEGNDSTYYEYIHAKLRKVPVGGSETEIADARGNTYEKGAGGAGSVETAVDTISIPVSNVLLKKGETLRLTLEQWGKSSTNPVTGYWYIGHDPKGRAYSAKDFRPIGLTFGTEPSNSTLQLPVKLDQLN
tara:strand:- start:39 stop:743 length:705 start_codon:yes stop_codon:yes gene_type:complete